MQDLTMNELARQRVAELYEEAGRARLAAGARQARGGRSRSRAGIRPGWLRRQSRSAHA
jgi:hypothetical protein